MKPARRFLVKAAKLFDLPADIAANLPHIELRGFEECSLDCHRAIIAYEPEKIIVAVNTGEVTIEGANLELRHMHRDRLTVTGRRARNGRWNGYQMRVWRFCVCSESMILRLRF